jgi:hypothetical protein
MAPIVDGLKAEYGDRVEFRSLNAREGEGETAFRALALRGHPSYVILKPDGQVVWQSLGEVPRETLEAGLRQALQ